MSGSLWGSPPRMRGKEEDHHQRPGGGRITPAHAGKSELIALRWEDIEDHPRVCGEKWVYSCAVWALEGSPPRMRGKGWLMVTLTVRNRITPAYAGKSLGCAQPAQHSRDHPRVCGEKFLLLLLLVAASGSPPRMRGKGSVYGDTLKGTGITPAYAGKSTLFCPPTCAP